MSRAARQFRAKNPGQHLVLTSMVAEKRGGSGERKPFQRLYEINAALEAEESRSRQRRKGEKTVTWSRKLLQVRSISPRIPRQRSMPRISFRSRSPSPPPQSSSPTLLLLPASSCSTPRLLAMPRPYNWGSEHHQDRTQEMEEKQQPEPAETSPIPEATPSTENSIGGWRSIPIIRVNAENCS